MSDLPEPLTPPDCDLRGMPYMPLDITRLFDSDFYVHSTGDEFKAAVTLWGKAFLQVPAGSLPDDDRVLAHLSNAGAKWKKVRSMALRGFVKCMDGRLYHPTVCEKALDAWKARQAQRERTDAARAAREAKRAGSDRAAKSDVTTSVTDTATTSVTDTVTGSKGREGKGREEKKEPLTPSPSSEPERAAAPPGPVRDKSDREKLAIRVAAAIGVPKIGDLPPNLAGNLMAEIDSMLAQNCDFDADLAPALATKPDGKWPGNPRYWGKIAIANRDRRLANPAKAGTASPTKLHPSERDKRLRSWLKTGQWAASWGPTPDEAGCCLTADEIADARAREAA